MNIKPVTHEYLFYENILADRGEWKEPNPTRMTKNTVVVINAIARYETNPNVQNVVLSTNARGHTLIDAH